MFEIPIVLFIFKRKKAVEIIKQISKVKPRKLYILGDGPRNSDESKEVEECRKLVEEAIDWDCEVIKNYAKVNRGVYENIGKGAMWVFKREKSAIFLEDDNYPELTFFDFCKEMLERYENNEKIMWICGTNYLEKFKSHENESYVFTQHMLPCGWASWSNKFLKYYDGDMTTYTEDVLNKVKGSYVSRSLYNNMSDAWISEHRRMSNGDKPISWDYQMDYSLKYYDLYGICPTVNQIKNIGVDEYSIHGGTSKDNPMIERFCENQIFPIEFPLKHPESININSKFEKEIGKILTPPLNYRMKSGLLKQIRRTFKIPYNIKTSDYFKSWYKK
ncbi:hypothetical protein LC085_09915 [Bacillus tianshenii]|uniref:hypothetical protein n=1 Tax=Sutcliffiella tianshenii TaxID=1463404 RepID=UPI001CD65D33|nr:hypothetical protein [Bacillus tianshenii]MCA1320221.1 hypothetical protein [Bacillus tianshenii]